MLGEGESGPANIHSNFRLAMELIRLACEAAFRSAAIGEQSLQHSHAGLGLAGAGIKNACDCLLSQKMPFASTVLETDAYVAWLGAHQGGDGAIVILGTGSCGLAFIKGRRIGVAGWGAEVSDEAGGQRMGREALRRTLWTLDGRAERRPYLRLFSIGLVGTRLKSSVLHQERHLLIMLSSRHWSSNMRRRAIP